MNSTKPPELNKIYTGDCLEIMRQWPDKCVDLVVTDPPYGIKRDKGFGGSQGFRGQGKRIHRRQYSDEWDQLIPTSETFLQMLRVSRNQIIFGGNFFAHLLPISTHWIFWDKLQTMPTFGDGELVWTSFKTKSIRKITFQYNGLLNASEDQRYHPTQKPSELIGLLLRQYSGTTFKSHDIIFDPFCGSGSTLVACLKNDLDFVGCEINPDYVKIAEERIARERSQLKLAL